MNWKLIFQLSLFGLIMAFGTLSLIPQQQEWIFWLAIFIFCAYVIAKTCTGKYFLHGFWLSMVNSVWITIAHVWFYDTYILHHASMATMANNIPYFNLHPRLFMVLLCPVYGAIFGLFQGLFAFVLSRFIKKKGTEIN